MTTTTRAAFAAFLFADFVAGTLAPRPASAHVMDVPESPILMVSQLPAGTDIPSVHRVQAPPNLRVSSARGLSHTAAVISWDVAHSHQTIPLHRPQRYRATGLYPLPPATAAASRPTYNRARPRAGDDLLRARRRNLRSFREDLRQRRNDDDIHDGSKPRWHRTGDTRNARGAGDPRPRNASLHLRTSRCRRPRHDRRRIHREGMGQQQDGGRHGHNPSLPGRQRTRA